MVWSFSHFVVDGWSMAVIRGELPVLYTAIVEGREPALPPARPFREYIGWLKRQDPEQAKEYWQRVLAGFEPPTPLPFDGTGGKVETDWQVARVDHAIPPATVRALQAFARRHQLTPNTVLQGLWGLLLGRWGALDDVVYGVIGSGRPHELEGVESMVGMFINGLPLRLRIDAGAALIPWLRRLQAEQFEQRELEYCSQEQVLIWSGLPRSIPLYDSLLVYENYPSDPLGTSNSGGLDFRDASLREAGNFALTLFVTQHGDAMALRLVYYWDRFAEAAVARLVDGLAVLLDGVLEQPDRRLGDLPLLRREQQLHLIAGAAGPRSQPPSVPVHRRIQEQAARTPDAIAVASAAGSITYGELDGSVRRLAARLRNLGVGPESIVGLCAERSPEMIVGLLAILKAGGAYVPLDPASPASAWRSCWPTPARRSWSPSAGCWTSRRKLASAPRSCSWTAPRLTDRPRTRRRSRRRWTQWSSPRSPTSSTPPARPAGPRG